MDLVQDAGILLKPPYDIATHSKELPSAVEKKRFKTEKKVLGETKNYWSKKQFKVR